MPNTNAGLTFGGDGLYSATQWDRAEYIGSIHCALACQLGQDKTSGKPNDTLLGLLRFWYLQHHMLVPMTKIDEDR
jgi:hypothetical protein